MSTLEEMESILTDELGVSQAAIDMVAGINGYNEQTMKDILYYSSGYRDFDQLDGHDTFYGEEELEADDWARALIGFEDRYPMSFGISEDDFQRRYDYISEIAERLEEMDDDHDNDLYTDVALQTQVLSMLQEGEHPLAIAALTLVCQGDAEINHEIEELYNRYEYDVYLKYDSPRLWNRNSD